MLIFETSCANRPFHDGHGIVICAKRLFVEKIYNFFGQKFIFGATIKVYFKLFFQLEKF